LISRKYKSNAGTDKDIDRDRVDFWPQYFSKAIFLVHEEYWGSLNGEFNIECGIDSW